MATSRSRPAPAGAISSTDAPNLPEKSAIGKARCRAPDGSQLLAASLISPCSAENTTTLPFFGTARLTKLIDGFDAMLFLFRAVADRSATCRWFWPVWQG